VGGEAPVTPVSSPDSSFQTFPTNRAITGLVLSGLAGACPRERDNFSLLILMIKHGDGWENTTSSEVLLPMQLLDNRSSFHRYSSLRISGWGI
jgi:hypothetical protein